MSDQTATVKNSIQLDSGMATIEVPSQLSKEGMRDLQEWIALIIKMIRRRNGIADECGLIRPKKTSELIRSILAENGPMSAGELRQLTGFRDPTIYRNLNIVAEKTGDGRWKLKD